MKCLLDPELEPGETALFHHVYQGAARLLAERSVLQPVAFFRAGAAACVPGLSARQVAMIEPPMPGNDEGKDAVAQALRKFARRADADLVILLFESWMVKPNEAEARYIQQTGEWLVRPSEHPHRIEIVFISVSKPGGHNWSAWVPIQRDAHGRPSIPAEPPRLEYLKADGRFSNLLDDE